MKKQKQRKIYHINELSLDDLMTMYKDYASSHNLRNHREKKVREAIEVLIHFIAQQELSHYDRKTEEKGVARIMSSKANLIIGDCYQDVRRFLIDSEIIQIVENYIVDTQAYGYRLNDKFTIKEWYESELYLHTYFDKLHYLDNHEAISKEEKAIRKQYIKCLNKLHIINENDFISYFNSLEFIDDNGNHNQLKELSYQYHKDICLSKYKHDVYSWDKYGRIHHFISNCPRGFRKYFNILFVRDIHNAQPLIISSLLFEYFNINKEVKEYLSYSIINNLHILNYKEIIKFYYNNKSFEYHYDNRNLYNNKIDNKLERIKNEISRIPIDVLEYCYLVISGHFWDVVSDRLGIARDVAKGIMFAEVFYSKTNRVQDWQKYGQMFQAYFPNVTAAIMDIKSKHEINWLACEMQRRESKVIRAVLEFLFDKGYDVINIHDEIVVIDTQNNLSKYAVDDYGDNMDVIEKDVENGIMFEMFSQLGLEGALGC